MTITNDFYEFTPRFIPETRVRASELNTQFDLLQQAFDTVGELSGLADANLLNDAIAGVSAINLGASTSYSLADLTEGVDSESRAMRLYFTGTPASAVTVTLPATITSKLYVVDNACGQSLTIKYAATDGVTIQSGGRQFVWCDGTTAGTIEAGHRQTAAEAASLVTPKNYKYQGDGHPGGYNVIRVDMRPSSSSATNSAAFQDAINVMEQAGGGIVWIPEGADSYDYNGNIQLKDKVSILCAGPLATVLACTQAGVPGLYAASALSGITLAGFQLVGTNAANASENGIQIAGDASGGFPKFVIRNMLVKQWGNIGIYLSNCFDALVEACNASSNKSHGFHLVSCFSLGGHKNVAYQNTGYGFHIQSAAGSFFSGTAQENSLSGWRVESAQGCTFATYLEQNGHAGSAATAAQFLLTQRSGGYAVSSGNKINVFALGGKGSTSPTYESGYGLYLDFAEDNEVNGSLGGHLTNDIIFTTNSSRNDIRTVKYLTGLAGGDTTTPVVNNSTNGTNLIPVKVNYTNATAGTANVGTGEDDLMSFSLPANAMFLNQQAIEIIAWGNTGNNTNNKQVKLYFGATQLIATPVAAAQSRDWELRAVVTRLSNTSQQGIARGNFNQASLASDFTAPAETLSGAVTIKVTGEATADGDITQRGLIVRGL